MISSSAKISLHQLRIKLNFTGLLGFSAVVRIEFKIFQEDSYHLSWSLFYLQMSSCVTGGDRSNGFELDMVKSLSTSSITSHSYSPSSTLSESSNSPWGISTRKPRTPRKRPYQTYHEAAALLSTIYPKIFSTKNLRKPCRHIKQYDFFSKLLPPSPYFDNADFILDHQLLASPIEPKRIHSSKKSCQGPQEIDLITNSASPCDKYEEDFDAESILGEEMEEGIDSILGNISANNDSYEYSNGYGYSNQMELGVRALRHVDDGDWWRFFTVHDLQISPKFNKVSAQQKKKKKKKKKKSEYNDEVTNSGSCKDYNSTMNSGFSLKLKYEEVLNAWSDRGSPFSDEILATDTSESDTLVCISSPARKPTLE
ncbi:hypothetical protein NE237_025585 [Protea cynaroides]|uniref:Uncharacterized protein n=1 Tax=Protea cynaroides TaxID=273540 RepID=A0A9Q0JZN2_9MAGN|nr:hypothetical protein NE237_025585 [Protea cynaroides]